MYRELSINDIDSMGQDTLGDRLILLHTGGNLGFAGGCNIGIVNVFLRF
jgi:GT2 family glycosyltransferase